MTVMPFISSNKINALTFSFIFPISCIRIFPALLLSFHLFIYSCIHLPIHFCLLSHLRSDSCLFCITFNIFNIIHILFFSCVPSRSFSQTIIDLSLLLLSISRYSHDLIFSVAKKKKKIKGSFMRWLTRRVVK